MTRQEIFQEVARIGGKYTVFQCFECADAIKAWLKRNRIQGVHLQLSAIGRTKFIVSQRWKGGSESIAQTGVHQGIEVYGSVFDNLSSDGFDRDDWVADFDCASGEFEIVELDVF